MKPNVSPQTSSAMRGRSEQGGYSPNDKRLVGQRQPDGKFLNRDKSTGIFRASYLGPKCGFSIAPAGFAGAERKNLPAHLYSINRLGTVIRLPDLPTIDKVFEQIVDNIRACNNAHPSPYLLTVNDNGVKFAERIKHLVLNQHKGVHVADLPPYKQHVVRHYRPDSPDFTDADKEWIDQIDGHALTVNDLY